MRKGVRHEDPANDYERMLNHAGVDCSNYGCWKPIAAIVVNRWGREIGVCVECARREPDIIRWLEH